jgi:tetraacyldisaccharide 4'-kinase
MKPETYHAIIRGERRGLTAFLTRGAFRVASGPYRLAMAVRNLAFDRGWKHTFTAAVPVISVGNLTLGGTGKTPCVEYVAQLFRDHGTRPVILSRGYGAEAGQNDEAMVLEENLPDVPHLQDADRVALAMTAVEELDAEVLILDDGFQHRRLNRNLDIVLIDSTKPLNRESMFPRGLLREPVGSLKRADVLIRCDQAESADQAAWLRERFPGKIIARAVHEPRDVPQELTAVPVAAFCGIGNPESFRESLNQLGATLTAWRQFPDHHGYTREDVESLTAWASELPSNAMIATTQKDWVKLRVSKLAGRQLVPLRIGFKLIEGEVVLHEKLKAFFSEQDAAEIDQEDSTDA